MKSSVSIRDEIVQRIRFWSKQRENVKYVNDPPRYAKEQIIDYPHRIVFEEWPIDILQTGSQHAEFLISGDGHCLALIDPQPHISEWLDDREVEVKALCYFNEEIGYVTLAFVDASVATEFRLRWM